MRTNDVGSKSNQLIELAIIGIVRSADGTRRAVCRARVSCAATLSIEGLVLSRHGPAAGEEE